MNPKSNQPFKSRDMFLVMAAILVSLLVLVGTFGRGFSDNRKDLAEKEAKNLAEQLVAGGLKFSEPKIIGARTPASVGNSELQGLEESIRVMGLQGQLGLDPWGRPFRFYISQSSGGEPFGVAVYSAGPDGEFQTAVDGETQPRTQSFVQGDDYGVFRAVH